MFHLFLSVALAVALLLPLPAPAQQDITEDPDFSEVTAVLPTLTMTVLLPKKKRHVVLNVWLQMQSPAWALRAAELESRISDAVIRDTYRYFYREGLQGRPKPRKQAPTQPADPIVVPTYGGGKGKYDDAIADYLTKQKAADVSDKKSDKITNPQLVRIIRAAANRAIGKERVVDVTIKALERVDE